MRFRVRLQAVFWISASLSFPLQGQDLSNEEAALSFFEARIRPVLAGECYECHSTNGKRKNGLALDTRDGVRKGGKSGPAVVPGDPAHSLLLSAIRHEHPDLHMPKNGPKLDDKVIADFQSWIAAGAHDPRDEPPAAAKARADAPGDWSGVLEQRKKSLWSFQPITDPPVPEVPNVKTQPPHLIDRFLQVRQQAAGLSQNPPADRAVLLRRLSYLLNGLPPSPELQAAFLNDSSPDAYDKLVNQLLGFPAYGETWGRHWLDWFRYADTHGSEGDPAIPHAWRYRDYVIRAFNADVPYPQLVRESLAGDLLWEPRLNAGGQNESIIGAAQLRMVLHAFGPTDALDEFVTFTDNQIDVASKAFLGLTVSCARCHHHKFDPISQEDYYALFGVFGSARPAMASVNLPQKQEEARQRMLGIKTELRKVMAAEWQKAFADMPGLMAKWKETEAIKKEGDLAGIGPWLALQPLPVEKFAGGWLALRQRYLDLSRQQEEFKRRFWEMRAKSDASKLIAFVDFNWSGLCPDLNEAPKISADFSCAGMGDRIIGAIFPPGFHTAGFSDKDRGILMSRRFKNEGGKVWVRVAGQGGATARYVVDSFPRSGLIYPKTELKSDFPQWLEWDVNYWKGERMHLEFTTAADAPVEAKAEDTRSWFSVSNAMYIPDSTLKPVNVPPSILNEPNATIKMRDEVVLQYQLKLRQAVEHWEKRRETPGESGFLSYFIRHQLLPNTVSEIPAARDLLEEYRRLEEALPFPTRVPGVMEGDPFNQPLYTKGELKQPAAEVPRRFLQGLDPTPFPAENSGRLELAEAILAKTNPLTDRVIVNRVWHHLFGRGLVATVDNFGKLGSPPSHPELLDHLAMRFRASGGSIRQLIRYIVTSEAFQAGSEVPEAAVEKDPNNLLLTHFTRHRLTAEAIRDSLLFLSGKLREGSPGEGAAANEPWRSVYLKLVRNNLPPLLTAFDFPPPVTTRGSRDSTNVPAQSLALLNDPQVQAWARDWASAGKSESQPEQRVEAMFRQAFGRAPTQEEVRGSLAYLEQYRKEEKEENARIQLLRERQAGLEGELNALRNSVAGSLKKPGATASTVEAYAEWTFDKDGGDSRGRLPLQLMDGAKIENGALLLDGVSAHAITGVLPVKLEEKTLEAWVQLDGLNQAGGGVLTVQKKDGSAFDAIVYAERDSGQWMAGSEFFSRTQPFQTAPIEQEAAGKFTHVAIVWKKDGTVSAFREGKLYGKPYKNEGTVTFEAGESLVILGCRHLPPSGNRLLKGRIARARLYDRALTEKELEQTAVLEKGAVTDADILAVLPDVGKEKWVALRKEIAEVGQLLPGKVERPDDPEKAWEALAHALMNTKELIYLR